MRRLIRAFAVRICLNTRFRVARPIWYGILTYEAGCEKSLSNGPGDIVKWGLTSHWVMLTSKKGLYTINEQRMLKSACASAQSGQSLLSLSYHTVAINSVSGQRRPWSACAFAQADQEIRCPHKAWAHFSCVGHQVRANCLSVWLEFIKIIKGVKCVLKHVNCIFISMSSKLKLNLCSLLNLHKNFFRMTFWKPLDWHHSRLSQENVLGYFEFWRIMSLCTALLYDYIVRPAKTQISQRICLKTPWLSTECPSKCPSRVFAGRTWKLVGNTANPRYNDSICSQTRRH